MALDMFILPWLVHYYQTAQKECKQFQSNQLLGPIFKNALFSIQVNELDGWLRANLAIIQRQQQQVNCALKQKWSEKNKPHDKNLDHQNLSILAELSDKQWSDWSSRATGKNQGFYDTAVFVSTQGSAEPPPVDSVILEISEEKDLTKEKLPEDAEKKEKHSFWSSLFWGVFRWIKRELATISTVSLVTSIVLMSIFSPSAILVAVCIAAAIGVTFSIIRPMWQTFTRWWHADTANVTQYYQCTDTFWTQSLERFQQVFLDPKQQDLAFYRFELPHLLYQQFCESGQAIQEAVAHRKPEHTWRRSHEHQHYRKKQVQILQEKLKSFQTQFVAFHHSLVDKLYVYFKTAEVKSTATGLTLHVDESILHTIHQLYAFLEIKDQLTIERWLQEFFQESLESSLELTEEAYLGSPLKKMQRKVQERLLLQYGLMSAYLGKPTAPKPMYLERLIARDETDEAIPITDIPEVLLKGFQSFCSKTFQGESWKIPYLNENRCAQLDHALAHALQSIGLSPEDLNLLDRASDKAQAIAALMAKKAVGTHLVEYFNLLNQAWQIHCIISASKQGIQKQDYLQRKQCLESLLEDWLLSACYENKGVESSMIQVLLLARFDLVHSYRDTYLKDQREQTIHQIWWYLVSNWLTHYFNQYNTASDVYEQTEVDLIKKYYQITKKIDMETCEPWLKDQLEQQATPQNKLTWLQRNLPIAKILNIPRLTQLMMQYQQSYTPLQETPHVITPRPSSRPFFKFF